MSDSDSSVDSDSGIRFKTQSVRNLSNKDNLIFDRQKKHNDYEYNKYDKRYNRNDDYKYRKRYKQSEDIIRSSRREDCFEDERTTSKRENLNKTYDSVSHKSKEYYESKRKKHISKSEDYDKIDPYGPSLPHHKHKGTQETKKDKLKHDEKNVTYGPILSNSTTLKSKDFLEVKKEIVKLEDGAMNYTYGPILPNSAILKTKDEIKNRSVKFEDYYRINETYGPILPNSVKKESVKLEDNKTDDCTNEPTSTEDGDTYGPCLPSKSESIIDDAKPFGPTFPPPSSVNESKKKDDVGNTYGPCFPASITKPKPKKIYGPSLPSSDNENDVEEVSVTSPETDRIYGPSLPSSSANINMPEKLYENMAEHIESSKNSTAHENIEQSDDEEDVIGPLLPEMVKNNRVQSELECRALELKMKLEFPSAEQKTREDWMIELPGIQKVSGLGPRKFRANPGPDLSDRSSWTDTPQEKSKNHNTKSLKNELKIEAENREIQRRDKEQEKIIKNHKKHSKRDKSLMDMHQQKLAKAKKEAGKTERRPFNRDIDLKLNMFDPEKKSRMMKNACLLDDKFSTGKSKYL